MKKGELFTLLFGVVLAIAGVFMFNLGQVPQGAKAVTNYTSNWQATQLYRLTHTSNTGTRTDLGAIGVSEWTVNGTVGSATFQETWRAPDPTTTKIDTGGNNNCQSHGYDQSKWLTSCTNFVGNNYGRVTFTLSNVAPTAVFSEGLAHSGGASKCINAAAQVSGCVATTGAYGFAFFGSGGSFSNFGQSAIVGLFMPLQWSVTGTIN